MGRIIHASPKQNAIVSMPSALERKRFRKSELYEFYAILRDAYPNRPHQSSTRERVLVQKVTIFYFVFSDFPFFKNIFKLFKFIFPMKIRIFIFISRSVPIKTAC